MKSQRGLTLVEVLVVIGCIFILALVVIPRFDGGSRRSRVARAKSDMRSTATAIESYMVDLNQYPACVSGPTSVNGTLKDQQYKMRMTFASLSMASPGDKFMTLTTPVSYLSTLPSDPYAAKGTVFGYINAVDAGWIMWSYGPDGNNPDRTGHFAQLDGYFDMMTQWDEEEEWKDQEVYDPFMENPSDEIIGGSGPNGAWSFDSTNGAKSPGDIWHLMGASGI